MIVRKLNHAGREVWRYPAVILREMDHLIVVEAHFNRDDTDLGYTTFRRGDRFVEYFYNDRWYNIFAVYDRDDNRLKGWYCNVCRPAVWDNRTIACEDLALDVWISPDRETRVMDRDEFTALSLNKIERKRSLAALDEILSMADGGQLPH